ncbi:hypothetical protein RF55_8718 [Lasius niger]|uniref:Helitron helicase-like domain-containing protein n=1 Tax=Lasius niger TaxID=67767 RepID=A0A0J7KME7_LASNI|nr:hypothetical protein RF55_8718 [Lasius niger]
MSRAQVAKLPPDPITSKGLASESKATTTSTSVQTRSMSDNNTRYYYSDIIPVRSVAVSTMTCSRETEPLPYSPQYQILAGRLNDPAQTGVLSAVVRGPNVRDASTMSSLVKALALRPSTRYKIAAIIRCGAMALSVGEESFATDPIPYRFVRKPKNVSDMGMDIMQKPGTDPTSWKIVAMPLDTFVALANNSYYSSTAGEFTCGDLDVTWTAVPVPVPSRFPSEIKLALRDVSITVPVWKGPAAVVPVSSWALWDKFWSKDNLPGIRRNTVLAFSEICTQLGVSDACGTALSVLSELYGQWYGGIAPTLQTDKPSPDYTQPAYGAWTYDGSALDKTGQMKSHLLNLDQLDKVDARRRTIAYNFSGVSPQHVFPTGVVRSRYIGVAFLSINDITPKDWAGIYNKFDVAHRDMILNSLKTSLYGGILVHHDTENIFSNINKWDLDIMADYWLMSPYSNVNWMTFRPVPSHCTQQWMDKMGLLGGTIPKGTTTFHYKSLPYMAIKIARDNEHKDEHDVDNRCISTVPSGTDSALKTTPIQWPDPPILDALWQGAKNYILKPAASALAGFLTGGPAGAAVAGATHIAHQLVTDLASTKESPKATEAVVRAEETAKKVLGLPAGSTKATTTKTIQPTSKSTDMTKEEAVKKGNEVAALMEPEKSGGNVTGKQEETKTESSPVPEPPKTLQTPDKSPHRGRVGGSSVGSIFRCINYPKNEREGVQAGAISWTHPSVLALVTVDACRQYLKVIGAHCFPKVFTHGPVYMLFVHLHWLTAKCPYTEQQIIDDIEEWGTSGGAPKVELDGQTYRSKWAWATAHTMDATTGQLLPDYDLYSQALKERTVSTIALKEEPAKTRKIITTTMASYLRQSYLMYRWEAPRIPSPISSFTWMGRFERNNLRWFGSIDGERFDHCIPKEFITGIVGRLGALDAQTAWVAEEEIKHMKPLQVQWGRRLFQQWLVDSYVKIEKDRINYCRDHQKELRTETYQGLRDYIQTMANNLNGRIGKMVILPSTFIGSPRNMLQNYQDAMAIVSKFGKPDLFITMTCNPKWREIKENILPGQQASDRPDICARVFNI